MGESKLRPREYAFLFSSVFSLNSEFGESSQAFGKSKAPAVKRRGRFRGIPDCPVPDAVVEEGADIRMPFVPPCFCFLV